MSRTTRVGLVAAVAAAAIVYTFSGSRFLGEEVIINIKFWSLLALPFIVGGGVWWIRKADR